MTELTEEQTEALQEIETFWRSQIAAQIMAAAPTDLQAVREVFRQCATIALGSKYESDE
jgi:cytochrome c1